MRMLEEPESLPGNLDPHLILDSDPSRIPAPAKVSGLLSVLQSIGSKAGILVLNAATGILTARALRPQGRGELAAMIIWSLFLASATTLGVPSSVIYYLRHRPELRTELKASAMIMSCLLGGVAALVGAIFLPLWLHQYPLPMIHAAQWFLLLTPICSMTLAGRAILEASDEFSMSNLVQTLSPAVTLVVLLGFLLSHRLTPYTAAISYILAAIPTFALLLLRLRFDWLQPGSFRISTCKLLLSYGVRSYGIDLLGTLALQVDQVLVVNLLTPSAMGSYVVVLSLSRMLNLFQNSVVMVLFPKAAGRTHGEVFALTAQSARLSTSITALCGLCVCLLGPLFLRLLYGKEYVDAVNALRVLVVEVTLSGLVFVLAQAFMALGRPGTITALQAIGLSLSIPTMLWLVPKLGVLGAAIALLLSTVARLVLVLVAFKFVFNSPLPDLVPRGSDFTTIIGRITNRSSAAAS
ncbi:MAG: lipopolysaccharide biosynthesis protein [Janthinobacterium lividum]